MTEISENLSVDGDDGKRIVLRLYETTPDEAVVIAAYNAVRPQRRAEWLRRLVIAGYAALHGGGVIRHAEPQIEAQAPDAHQVSRQPTTNTGTTPAPMSAKAAVGGMMGDTN